MIEALLWLVLYAAPPEITLQWFSRSNFEAVKIAVRGSDSFAEECLNSGLELRYRYELRWCRRAAFWIDDCLDDRREVHSLQYDPISQTYRFGSDRLEDSLPPESVNLASRQDAFQSLRHIENLPLSFLKPDFNPEQDRKSAYVQLRLLTQCRGDYNKTLERISYLLSLGLVRTSGYDSGWLSFPLD